MIGRALGELQIADAELEETRIALAQDHFFALAGFCETRDEIRDGAAFARGELAQARDQGGVGQRPIIHLMYTNGPRK